MALSQRHKQLWADWWWAAVRTWYGDEQVEPLQDVHLLEPSGVDEGVNLALTAAIQEFQTILCAHQQVHTWGHTCTYNYRL